MRPTSPADLARLCLHTITTKPWNIEQAAKHYASAGIKGITVWRDALEGRNIFRTSQMLRDHNLTVVSLCRGGFFASRDRVKRQKAIDDNRKAIEEASLLGTDKIVLVCGADPAQSLEESRKQIRDGIAAIIPDAQSANVRLAIEPLHPMYADVRSAINTLKQANDLAEVLNPPVESLSSLMVPMASPTVGVAVDVYHLWWDPDLESEIARCGRNGNLLAFHISDWKSPTLDLLHDRGLMGEGCIPIRKIRSWVEAAGFKGFNEVEIFSNIYWQDDQKEYLRKIIRVYITFA